MRELVKNTLKPFLNEIYLTCQRGFEEAKRDRFWDKGDNRYRSTRISAITTHLLEEKFKALGVFTNRSHNTFRFKIGNVVGRYKKLNSYSKLPQNVETYRNNVFIKRQLNIFNPCGSILTDMENIPITVGYYTDKFYSKILAIEVICHALDFRFEVTEPQVVANISNLTKEPVRTAKIRASKKAKDERFVKDGKYENNAEH